MTGMTTDLFDVTVPNFNDEDIAAIKKYNPNGELVGDKLTTITTDFLGYGYIGINADNVKIGEDKSSDASKALRRALATLLAALWTAKMPHRLLAPLPPVICDGVIVGGMITWYEVGFTARFWPVFAFNGITVAIGELIVLFTAGSVLYTALRRRRLDRTIFGG